MFTCRNGAGGWWWGKLSAPHMGWDMPQGWGNCMGSGREGDKASQEGPTGPSQALFLSVGVYF